MHLKKPQIKPNLDAGFTIFALDDTNGDFSRFEGPFLQHFSEIAFHASPYRALRAAVCHGFLRMPIKFSRDRSYSQKRPLIVLTLANGLSCGPQEPKKFP